jgi:hypothetical protein
MQTALGTSERAAQSPAQRIHGVGLAAEGRGQPARCGLKYLSLLHLGLVCRFLSGCGLLEHLDGLANLIRQRGRRLDQVEHFQRVEALEKHASDLGRLRRVGGGYELVQRLAEGLLERGFGQAGEVGRRQQQLPSAGASEMRSDITTCRCDLCVKRQAKGSIGLERGAWLQHGGCEQLLPTFCAASSDSAWDRCLRASRAAATLTTCKDNCHVTVARRDCKSSGAYSGAAHECTNGQSPWSLLEPLTQVHL